MFLQETLRKTHVPAFSSFCGLPAFLGLWPFLHVHTQQRSIFKSLSPLFITFASLTLQAPSFPFNSPCGYIGPAECLFSISMPCKITPTKPGQASPFKILNLITPTELVWTREVTFPDCRIRTWATLPPPTVSVMP